MTYRCSTCDLLAKTDENPNCENQHNCSFKRIETIHLASPSGTGPVVGKGFVVGTGEDGKEEVAVPAEMRLHCNTKATRPQFSDSAGVTCVDCLSTIPTKEVLDNGNS